MLKGRSLAGIVKGAWSLAGIVKGAWSLAGVVKGAWSKCFLPPGRGLSSRAAGAAAVLDGRGAEPAERRGVGGPGGGGAPDGAHLPVTCSDN